MCSNYTIILNPISKEKKQQQQQFKFDKVMSGFVEYFRWLQNVQILLPCADSIPYATKTNIRKWKMKKIHLAHRTFNTEYARMLKMEYAILYQHRKRMKTIEERYEYLKQLS